MTQTMGQIIKKLRKERNWTQEELAELLNISPQSVSKWENETSMPDISQVVPLANVFAVSTDVLFGTFGVSEDEEARKIIADLYREDAGDLGAKRVRRMYDEIQEALRRYPNNITLLMQSLELGLTLAYPDNAVRDEEHGGEIYRECVRQANIIFSHPQNVSASDLLRAHMIMVMLHASYGDYKSAWTHYSAFPMRADFTLHNMAAYIAHAEKDYEQEAKWRQSAFMFNLLSVFSEIALLGEAYRLAGKHSDAITVFEMLFKLNDVIFADEKLKPPSHYSDSGDAHDLIARVYLETGDVNAALEWLTKMVDYDTDTRAHFNDDMRVVTPLLRDIENLQLYMRFNNIKIELLSKLNEPVYDALRGDKRFAALTDRANAMPD